MFLTNVGPQIRIDTYIDTKYLVYLHLHPCVDFASPPRGHLQVLSFAVLERVTSVTHAQLRLGKRAVSLLWTVILFNDLGLNPKSGLGMALAFTGLVLYLFLKPRPNATPSSTSKASADAADAAEAAASSASGAVWVSTTLPVTLAASVAAPKNQFLSVRSMVDWTVVLVILILFVKTPSLTNPTRGALPRCRGNLGSGEHCSLFRTPPSDCPQDRPQGDV